MCTSYHSLLYHTASHYITPHYSTQHNTTPHHLAQVTIQRYEREKADEEPCLLAADIAVDSKDTDENITTPIMMYVLYSPFLSFRNSPSPHHISHFHSTPLYSSPLLSSLLSSTPHHSTLLFSSPLSALRSIHPEWNVNPSDEMIGMTYDGRAALYTSEKLDFHTVPNTCKVPSRGQSVRATIVECGVV